MQGYSIKLSEVFHLVRFYYSVGELVVTGCIGLFLLPARTNSTMALPWNVHHVSGTELKLRCTFILFYYSRIHLINITGPTQNKNVSSGITATAEHEFDIELLDIRICVRIFKQDKLCAEGCFLFFFF